MGSKWRKLKLAFGLNLLCKTCSICLANDEAWRRARRFSQPSAPTPSISIALLQMLNMATKSALFAEQNGKRFLCKAQPWSLQRAPDPAVFNDDESLDHEIDSTKKSLSVVSVVMMIRGRTPKYADPRAPVDLVTVLDISGSMAGTKLALLKRAMGFVIQNLGPMIGWLS
ncbi:hypothetical protein SASPL_151227 [Salvia splendens]|uniref:VWFA domain-containing protein n=1 Tax=Salvia splendens TaxID=180675 RepID=A0A8X8W8V6_SALSN|nr:hypothetical protein SASPL_151227 [Salvia splendens]